MQKAYKLNKDFVLTCVKDEIKNTMYTKVTLISLKKGIISFGEN